MKAKTLIFSGALSGAFLFLPAQLASAHPVDRLNYQPPVATVVVAPGGSLSSIAPTVDRTWQQLAGWNHLNNPNTLSIGEVLAVPPAGYVPAAVTVTSAPIFLVPMSHPAGPVTQYYIGGKSSTPNVAPAGSGVEQCVIWHESRGDPTAVNPWSGASGLFGFLDSTWRSVTGLPGKASGYSVGVQTAAFWKLYRARGLAPWAGDGC